MKKDFLPEIVLRNTNATMLNLVADKAEAVQRPDELLGPVHHARSLPDTYLPMNGIVPVSGTGTGDDQGCLFFPPFGGKTLFSFSPQGSG